MADHAEPALTQVEPATISEVVRYLLAALITTGWLTINSTTIDTIATVVGMLASLVLTLWTRNTVTPVAEPRDATGAPLVTQPKS